jgi:hypothetical protein
MGQAPPERCPPEPRSGRVLRIARLWSGDPAPASEHVEVRAHLDAEALAVEVDAPFHGDPAPPAPPGPTDRLWEHEVVELFLLGEGERYLEIELGPLGHHLVLSLHGRRRVERQGMAIEYAARRRGGRWSGRARVPIAWLPPGLRACNAYAIHGAGPARRHLAAFPVPGPEPDFHRLERFGPW